MKLKIIKLLKKIKKSIVEYVMTNRLFIVYVLLSLIGAMLVRKFTVNNLFAFKPFITDLGMILLIGSIGYLIKPKNQFKYYFTWMIIFTILNIISSIYYKFYTSFASFGELATVGQVKTVTGSIFEKLAFTDIMYIFIPILFYIIHKKLSSTTYYTFISKLEKSKKMIISTFVAGILCLAMSFITATKTDYSRLAKQWNRIYIVERFGIIMYQFNDLIQTLTPRINSLFGIEEAKDKFNIYFENKEEHKNNRYTGVLKGKNIIFVHLESIQTFLMDLEFNGVEATPNLNRLAKEGMFFKNFYPQISTGTSSDTEFTLNTGLLPAASGIVFQSYYNRNYLSLPKYFKDKGYYTFSMHGNLPSMWNRNKAHPALGYEEMYFRDSFDFTKEDVVNLGINDALFFEQGVKIMEDIEKTKPNYMGTIITLSNHSPFNQASKLSDLDLSTSYEKIDEMTGEKEIVTNDYLSSSSVGRYIKSANYADVALGKFIEYINESNEFENTLFVFYGDHDAKLSRNEINYLYNLNPLTGETLTEKDSNYVNYDYYAHELNKKTPLIMWSKNKKLKRIFKGEIPYTMGMYDIAPTILNMYSLYNKYTVGNDIFNTKHNNVVVFPNGNFLTEKVYYNNSTDDYKILKENTIVDDEYINDFIKTANERLEISNGIILYDLLKGYDVKEK